MLVLMIGLFSLGGTLVWRATRWTEGVTVRDTVSMMSGVCCCVMATLVLAFLLFQWLCQGLIVDYNAGAYSPHSLQNVLPPIESIPSAPFQPRHLPKFKN